MESAIELAYFLLGIRWIACHTRQMMVLELVVELMMNTMGMERAETIHLIASFSYNNEFLPDYWQYSD